MVMASVTPLRYGLALAVIAASALLADTPPPVFATGAVETDQVTVRVSVDGACEGQESSVSFSPTIETELGTLIEGGVAQTAVVDLSISDGLDSSCNETNGYVDFTETGFTDPMLDWRFFCDGVEVSAISGTYTCASDDGLTSPRYVDLEVEALTGAELGFEVDSNTISFTLYAEPPQ